MGTRELHRLSPKAIEKMKVPGRFADGGGLYLQVQEAIGREGVTKSWLFRYTLNGKAREMGLGPAHTIPLASYKGKGLEGVEREVTGARDLAADARRLLLQGLDPIEVRNAARAGQQAAAAKSKTFEQCARDYVKAHRASWRNTKHAGQWESTLETYAYPKIGKLQVRDIETAHVIDVLEPIWETKRETAARLRGRIEAVLNRATALELRDVDAPNPARWRGHLDQILSERINASDRVHHAALPFKALPQFVKDLRAQEGIAAKALEFTILTAARTNETIGATWDEFDMVGRYWTVPAGRMKGKRAHRVPLSSRAIEIVEEMRKLDAGDHVFPGGRREGLSNMAMLKTLERMKRDDLTVHGFRSTFRDWAGEQTHFAREVIEMALAHSKKDKTEEAYWRGDLFEKRRKLMEAWAGYCDRPAKEGSVTPIRAAKHL